MEAMLKLIVIGRKNHYFFKSSVGAAVSDTLLSVIATAKGTDINVFEYIVLLTKVDFFVAILKSVLIDHLVNCGTF